jgi:hypothetical protein
MLWCILVAWVAGSCIGCTLIQVSHYMSPEAPGAAYSRDPLGFDVASIYSGPPNSLTLETDVLRLGLSCWNAGYTPILIGPAVFPVLPIVLLAPVLGEPLETDPLRLALYLEPKLEPIGVVPGRVEVVDTQNGALAITEVRVGPGSPPHINDSLDTSRWDEVTSEEEIIVERPMLFVLEVEGTKEASRSSIQVTVESVTHLGSQLKLPVIRLTSGSGLEMQMGP